MRYTEPDVVVAAGTPPRNVRRSSAVMMIGLLSLVVIGCGCNFIDPNVGVLSNKFGAVTIPNEYGFISFEHQVIDDERFAEALPYLRRIRAKHVILSGHPITDRSVDGLLTLRQLNRIDLRWTLISSDGLKKFSKAERLRVIDLEPGRLSDDQLRELQAALKDIWLPVHETGSAPGPSVPWPLDPPM